MRTYHCLTCREQLASAYEAASHELIKHNVVSFTKTVETGRLWKIVKNTFAFLTKKRHAGQAMHTGGRT
jgi:hypothetical protein